jgi:hypothetical protein
MNKIISFYKKKKKKKGAVADKVDKMTLEKEGRAEEVGQVAIMHKVEEEQKVAKEVKEAKAVAVIEKTITNREI